jgi:hypothetical protein
MKRFTTLAIICALFTLSGCTFDTDIDADVYDNGTQRPSGEDRCDGIAALLDGETDPDVRQQLEGAYDRCLNVNSPDDPDQPPRPDECDVIVETTEDGEEVERRHCPNDPDDPREPGDPTDPNDPDQCEIVEVQTDDGEIVEEERCTQPQEPGDCDAFAGADGEADDQSIQDWYAECLDSGRPAEECEEAIRHCTDPNTGSGGNGDICDDLSQHLQGSNVDPADLSEDEAFAICVDRGLDEQTCRDLIASCYDGSDDPDNGSSGGNQDTCDQVRDYLEQQGYELPLAEDEADALFQECRNSMDDPALCDQLLQCTSG